jgi:SAM-dependent methyltransferase
MQASPVMFAAAPGSSPISWRSGITLSDAKSKENAHTAARFDTLRLATLRFADASLGGVLAILVVQHLPHPAAFIAEIRRCLRPGGHLLITAPARDSTSLASQNLYWRLRAMCYQRVPGVVRFYDTNSLPRLVEDQGLTVVECNGAPGHVSVLARASL